MLETARMMSAPDERVLDVFVAACRCLILII